MHISKTKMIRTRTGMAVIELIVILPLLLIMVFGVVEFGWFLQSHQILMNAARQGARAAVRIENSNPEVIAAVEQALRSTVDIGANDLSVGIARLNDDGSVQYVVESLDHNEEGASVRVTATVPYSLMNPPSFFNLTPQTITAYAVMQRSN